MHGIYSWVSPQVRQECRDIINRKLKPGGIVYVSYNTQPGWAHLMPIWKIFQSHIKDVDGTSLEKTTEGLKYLRFLRDRNATVFKQNHRAGKFIDELLSRDPHYVAHEFCNGAFEPLYFEDVVHGFADCDLSYAGTARLYRNDIAKTIAPNLRLHVQSGKTASDREIRSSIIRNEFFRRDVFIRASEDAKSTDQIDMSDLYIAPAKVSRSMRSKAKYSYQTVDFTKPTMKHIRAVAHEGAFDIQNIIANSHVPDIDAATGRQMVTELLMSEKYVLSLAPQQATDLQPSTRFLIPSTLNRSFLNRTLASQGKVCLSSPVQGSAFRVDLVTGILTRGLHEGTLTSAKAHLAQTIQDQPDDDKSVYDGRKSVHDFVEKAGNKFADTDLPDLVRLGIVVPS
jgi:hypothetical protein